MLKNEARLGISKMLHYVAQCCATLRSVESCSGMLSRFEKPPSTCFHHRKERLQRRKSEFNRNMLQALNAERSYPKIAFDLVQSAERSMEGGEDGKKEGGRGESTLEQ